MYETMPSVIECVVLFHMPLVYVKVKGMSKGQRQFFGESVETAQADLWVVSEGVRESI